MTYRFKVDIWREMMHQDNLGEFVRKALLHTGCDPTLITDLDSHATVQIELMDNPTIYVGTTDDFIVIWSDLCDYYESIIRQYAFPLLKEVMSGFRYSRVNQSVLRESEGKLQMYIDVAERYVEQPEAMATAINGFFEKQDRFIEIIRQ